MGRETDVEKKLPLSETETDREAILAFQGVHRALQYTNSSGRGPLTEGIIREIHRRCMDALLPETAAGKYRTMDVGITKAVVTPPHWSSVPGLMREYVAEVQRRCQGCGCGLNCLPEVIETMAFAHYAFARIHPFEDGNGRTVRLVCDRLARQHKLKPIIVWPSERQTYIDALSAVDKSGNLAHLELFLAGSLEDRYSDGKVPRDMEYSQRISQIKDEKLRSIQEQVSLIDLSRVWKPFGWPCFE